MDNSTNIHERNSEKNNKAMIISNYGLGDHINMIPAANYLSLLYDTVVIVCLEKNKQKLEYLFINNNKIKISTIKNNTFINKRRNINNYKEFTDGYDIYISGGQNIDNKIPNNIKSDLPFSFYEEMNINYDIFWKNFTIPYNHESTEKYNIIKNIEYIFLHNSCSYTKDVFNYKDVLNKFNISKDDTLVINAEENIYDKTHKFYDIAQKFVYLPIHEYIDTIINAKLLVLTDSCFFCLSVHLPIKTKECYIISRKSKAIPNGKNYDYFHDEKYGFNKESGLPIFKTIVL